MNRAWRRFIFCQLPGAVVALALIAQALAFALSNIPLWRDRADELALAVSRDPTNYRILLLGDSITGIATARFALGAPGDIANLSTHAIFGLSGSLFLLQRFLGAHPAPQYVVIAWAPLLYHFDYGSRITRYHLWHTFNRPDERGFLSANYPGIERRDWLPAIVELQERVVEPFISFLRQRYLSIRKRPVPSLAGGLGNPSPEARVEHLTHVDAKTEAEILAAGSDLTMTAVNAEALSRICELSEKYGFRVNMVWPPMPDELATALKSSGALAQLEAKIRSIMDGHCYFHEVMDFNKVRTYSTASFHHDLVHLFGDGWEQRYSSDLRAYLSGLLHSSSSAATR